MALVLTQQVETLLPIEVTGLTPHELSGKSLPEIEKLDVWHGRRKLELGSVFNVSGSLGDQNMIVFDGNLKPVHGIGSRLHSGTIRIDSDAGRRVGCQMSGGAIIVSGSVSDFLGAEMTGGQIRVSGDAGDAAGGHLPGSKIGMNRGSIFVKGSVGKGAGQTMRRGTIVIGGDAGELLGWNMLAGTIVVFGQTQRHVGSEMKRGTLVLVGGYEPDLLPTFSPGLKQPVPTLAMLANWIGQQEFDCDLESLKSSFQMYHGDTLQGGRGEIFVRSS